MISISRRRLLFAIAATGAVAAAGVGAGIAALTDLPPRRGKTGTSGAPGPRDSDGPAPPPAQLTDALHREEALIARLDLALSGTSPISPAAAGIRADHVAHANAIRAAIGVSAASPPAASGPTSPVSSVTSIPSTPAPTSPSVAQLIAAERAAQQQTGEASAQLRGADAVLLASIAACEAGHVELLS